MFKLVDQNNRYVAIDIYGRPFKILRVDFDRFEDEFFVATDEDGKLYVYQQKPYPIDDYWYNKEHYYISKVTYEGDWRHSLQLIKK